jgi:beta-aspartyl-peptidase (threonine type)
MAMTILIHGGSGRAAGREEKPYRAGLLAAAEAGFAVLDGGGDAVEAVLAAVRSMEDDPVFNAGKGSVLNARGEVECDAAVMRGRDRKFGAVAAVKAVCNPVLLAREVLDSPQVLLVAGGAQQFAEQRGLRICDPAQLITQQRFQAWADWMSKGQPATSPELKLEGCDTVGAVALDAAGNLAAATSTGGISYAPPGRVGDSPLPGCGFWADRRGAASATGEGEQIARVLLSHAAVESLANPEAPDPIDVLGREVGGVGGVIWLGAAGDWHAAYNTEIMGYAWRTQEMEHADVSGTGPRRMPSA